MVDKIRRLCKEQGKSLFSLEQECGLGNGTINKWDRNSPSVAKVHAVANALGVPVSYLIDEQEKKPTPDDGDGLSAEQLELVRLFESASPALRAAALAVLKSGEGQDKAPGDARVDG